MIRRMTVLFGRIPYTTMPRDLGFRVVSSVVRKVLVVRDGALVLVLVLVVLVVVELCVIPAIGGRTINLG